MNKEKVIKKLKRLEGFAGLLDKKRLSKSSDFSGLRGKPDTRVRGSSKYGLYYDSKGLLTTGYGDLVESLDEAHEKFFTTEKEANTQLDKHYREKKKYLNKLIPKVDSLNPDLQESLLMETFRGMVPKSPDTLKLINQGKYEEAAYEFLDSNEYKNTKSKGIIDRFNNVHDALLKEAAKKKLKKASGSRYEISRDEMVDLRNKYKGKPYAEFESALREYLKGE